MGTIIEFFKDVGMSHLLITAGIILTMVGGVMSAREKTRSDTKLNKLAKEIERLSRQSADVLTSAGSFCYIWPVVDDKTSITFLLVHKGNNPLYDVKFKATDFIEQEKLLQKEPITLKNAQKISIEKNIGNFGKEQMKILNFWQLQQRNEHKYRIVFTTLHGSFMQY